QRRRARLALAAAITVTALAATAYYLRPHTELPPPQTHLAAPTSTPTTALEQIRDVPEACRLLAPATLNQLIPKRVAVEGARRKSHCAYAAAPGSPYRYVELEVTDHRDSADPVGDCKIAYDLIRKPLVSTGPSAERPQTLSGLGDEAFRTVKVTGSGVRVLMVARSANVLVTLIYSVDGARGRADGATSTAQTALHDVLGSLKR
ncbi:hypothetical protein, partial [Actinocorallia lasiicapitis]